MSDKKWREWVINSLDNNDDGPDVYVIGPNAHDVKVIEIGAVEELQSQLAAEREKVRGLREAIQAHIKSIYTSGGPYCDAYSMHLKAALLKFGGEGE